MIRNRVFSIEIESNVSFTALHKGHVTYLCGDTTGPYGDGGFCKFASAGEYGGGGISGYWGAVPGCWGAVPGCWGAVPGCSGTVPGCWGAVPGCWGAVPGCSGTVPGCWGAVPGCSGAVPGCWGAVPGSGDDPCGGDWTGSIRCEFLALLAERHHCRSLVVPTRNARLIEHDNYQRAGNTNTVL